MKTLFITFLLLLRVVSLFAQTTWYVDVNADCAQDGTSWINAFTTIQEGINAASDDDIVIVADGTYNSGATTENGLGNRIVLKKDITVISEHGAGSTTITGASDDGTFGPDAIRPVYISAGTLDGFTITGGYTNTSGSSFGNGANHGGGVAMSGGTITNCIITGNNAYNRGGGVDIIEGTISFSTISNNTAGDYGGGVNFYDGGIVNCCLVENNATNNTRGGGAFLRTSGTIANSLVINNTAVSTGGGLDLYGNDCLVHNCTVYNNTSSSDGGGINVSSGSPYVYNSISFNNTASSGTHDIDGTNTNFYYCWSTDGIEKGTNGCIIGTDPGFEDEENNDFYLSSGSECLDAGNSSNNYGPYDLAVGNRIMDDNVNMGAYETKIPTVSTTAISNVTSIDADGGGNVTNAGDELVTAKGVCYSTIPRPTTLDNTTSNGSGTGSFTSDISSLIAGSDYYVRAYATSAAGTAYGDEVSLSTLTTPTVTTAYATNIGGNSATVGGNVAADGELSITAYGIEYSTTSGFTNGSGTAIPSSGGACNFTVDLTGLERNTTYYVHAYATNNLGTSYGDEKSFTTLDLPIVTTDEVTDVNSSSARLLGNLSDLGNPASISAHGFKYTNDPDWNSGILTTDLGATTSTGNFESSISSLDGGETYYFTAYATNATGTSYGDTLTFDTYEAPVVTTAAVSEITNTTATANGNITTLGVEIPENHGFCYNTTGNPTIADSYVDNGQAIATGTYTASLTDLTPGETYYVKAYATNVTGTVYGDEESFTTLNPPVVTTQNVSSIETTAATGNGNITNLGGSSVTQHGVCYSSSEEIPTTNDSKTTEGIASGTGAYTSSITGLTSGTTYYLRAYATNTSGTAYGEVVSFTTGPKSSVVTDAVSDITGTSATGNGNVIDEGDNSVTSRGIEYSTNSDFTPGTGTQVAAATGGTGAFTASLTGLEEATYYYVRAYSTSTDGTSYGEQESFNTTGTVNVVYSNLDDRGEFSLRSIYENAADGSTITFKLSEGNETITISSQINIDKNITIDGSNASGSGTDITIQANAVRNTATYRIFDISAGTVNLFNMTLRHGKAYNGGGAIRVFTSSTTTAELNINNCTLSNNDDVKNSSSYGGGALFLNGRSYQTTVPSINITNSTISGNVAVRGAGVFSNNGTVSIINSTLANNSASGYAGAAYLRYSTEPVNLNFVTIAENTGGRNTGGIKFYCTDGTIKNSLLGNNTPTDFDKRGTCSITDEGYNIVESSYAYTWTGVGDITGEQDNLFGCGESTQTLEDNGGATQTLAVNFGSVALGAGIDDASYSDDQRGETRADPPTIGAYEYGGSAYHTWNESSTTDWNTASNWDKGSVPTSSDDVLIPKGLHPVISSATGADCNSLLISDGGSLTIASDASGTGSLIIDGCISNNGTITSQTYLAGDAQAWHMVSGPAEVDISDNTWNPGDNDDFYAWYEQSPGVWVNYKNTTVAPTFSSVNGATDNFLAGKGYLVAYNSTNPTKSFTGTLNTGDVTFPLANSATGKSWTYTEGWNLMGNPYSSSIDWNRASRTQFQDNYAYAYDPNKEGGEDYVYVNGSAANAYIPPHQGFLVLATTAANGTDFTFDASAIQTHGSGANVYKQKEADNGLVLRLTHGVLFSETEVYIHQESSADRDRYDALKLYSFNPEIPQLLTYSSNGVALAVNGLPGVDFQTAIPLGLRMPEEGTYTLSLQQLNGVLSDEKVFLEDRNSRSWHLLSDSPYTFTSLGGMVSDRFVIRFSLVGITLTPATTLRAWYANQVLYIEGESGDAKLLVTDLTGRICYTDELQLTGSDAIEMNLTPGVYIVALRDQTGVRSTKLLIGH